MLEGETMRTRIAIVGEPVKASRSQIFLDKSLDYLQDKYGFQYEWVETTAVTRSERHILESYDAIWSAPGGQFKSTEGALSAIRYAREKDVPHLATCGGFQHTILEIARDILGIPEAEHEEYAPESQNLVITKMACSLKGQAREVLVDPETLASNLYKKTCVQEDFLCAFGINPAFRQNFDHPLLKLSGKDKEGEIRILELPQNRFFIATLFVPQLRSTKENPHPIIEGFVRAACKLDL